MIYKLFFALFLISSINGCGIKGDPLPIDEGVSCLSCD
jgi:predicted small lipoprotein YifL